MVSKADPKVFEGAKYTRNTAAEYLQKLSGNRPKGHDAHHIIPKAVHGTLKRLGSEINPNAPHLMTWWKRSGEKFGGTHQNFWKKYNDRWEGFFDKYPEATDDDIMKFAREMAEEYKDHYWNKKYYFELYREVPQSSWSKYR